MADQGISHPEDGLADGQGNGMQKQFISEQHTHDKVVMASSLESQESSEYLRSLSLAHGGLRGSRLGMSLTRGCDNTGI